MSRIVLVSPYRDLSLLVRSVAAEMRLPLEVLEGTLTEQGWLDAAGMHDEILAASDVIVSRGGTAHFLSLRFACPVVTLATGFFDLVECCKQAKAFSDNIVITTFKPLVGLNLVEEVLGVTITEVVIKTMPELKLQIARLAEEGNYCLVGGGPSVRYAAENGIPSVFLRTGRDTIREALLRAAELAKLHCEEKRRAGRLQAILECANEGVLAVDEAGNIEICNSAAEKMLGIQAKAVLGRQVGEVVANTRMQEVLANGVAHINEIQDVGDVRIVTSRVPIRDGVRIVGAVATFQEAARIAQIEQRLRKEATPAKFAARRSLADILGDSPLIRQKKELAKKFAASDLTVFINGPSGTGKELFAQGIHQAGKRRRGPFVAVNCGALPQSLLESELFGYAEGAFTGAKRKGKPGLFEMAHGGTIFLDEVDAMPFDMQGRLLRVLQEREVLRIGAEGIIPVDIRVIAASNKSLSQLLDGLIRADLFYRLNVLHLEIPPLRLRKEDIPLLCREFLPADKREAAEPLLKEMLPCLLQYSWPGNVRELLNFAQRLTFFLDERAAGASGIDLLRNIAPDMLAAADGTGEAGGLREQVAAREEAIIARVMDAGSTLAEAAAQLGVPKTTLWRKIQRLRKET